MAARKPKPDAVIHIPEVIRVCSPREAAELLYMQVMSSNDPEAVVKQLRIMLESSAFALDLMTKQQAEGPRRRVSRFSKSATNAA